MELSIMEQLCFNTVRIETLDINKNSFSGTGFFFNLSIDGEQVPLLVTNKHVVEGMISGKFVLTEKDEEGNPIYKQHYPIEIGAGFDKFWIKHPDPYVDLPEPSI